MDKQIQKILEKAKTDSQTLAVAIFGSYARNEPYRDIDVCILLKDEQYTDFFLAKKRLKFTLENEKYDVQIFQSLPLYIRIKIFKEMKLLFCRNEDALYDLYFKTERDFEHFEPIYNSYLEGVLNE